VQFGAALRGRLAGAVEDLLVRHDVALRRLQVGAERAESAAVHAHVRRVEVLVDVVIGDVAVLRLADAVRQFAEGEQVGVRVEVQAVVEREADAGADFVGDVGRAAVGCGHGRPRVPACFTPSPG
jgi:hypothetical protein